ncbi:Hypothetical predicted protein [Xyrichtys novacula]|uniref:Uncharacterized protein n=1 Tax=Xyrichtys novacula TaxID=13765 RepID=A0AAV1HNG0_XYRNO|nr:Hypothetical predicted protein [Xyrichtys novacula]
MDDVIYSGLKFSADPITLLINKYIIIHNNETCSNSQYSAERKQEEEEEEEEKEGIYGTTVNSFRYISLSADNTNTVRFYIYKSSTFLPRQSRHSQVVVIVTGRQARARREREPVYCTGYQP